VDKDFNFNQITIEQEIELKDSNCFDFRVDDKDCAHVSIISEKFKSKMPRDGVCP
jgi:hypothetical protein